MMGQCLESMVDIEHESNLHPFNDEVQTIIAGLKGEQMSIFKMVFAKLRNEDDHGQLLLMVHGEAGTGKSHLYKAICNATKIMKIGTVVSASTGIAATVIPGCLTVHSTFGIPIYCAPDREMKKSPSEVIKKAKLLIIDEISMLDKKVLECVDKKLRKFCENEMPFAGKSVIMSGDRQQLVPPSGLKNSIYACVELMTQFHHVELREQMRQSGDPEFNQWLRRIGTGQINWVKIPPQNVVANLEELIHFVYGPDLKMNNGGLIIAPTNRAVNQANEIVLQILDGVEKKLVAKDTLANGMVMPAEEELTKIPPKSLKLKTGAIVMLLKNVNIEEGLANGTRLIFQAMDRGNCLICKDLTGKEHRIPRITMNQQMKDGTLRRLQFPVRLAFVTTIHKSQSQTVDRLGIFMPEKSYFFSEGMCYTAMSRLRRMDGMRIFAENANEEILLRNLCSPFALATITVDGKWIPAPELNE